MKKNTLVARYSFTRNSVENQGISNTSLPSRAYETKNTEHEIRLTETMILNPTTINETRFEYSRSNRDQIGDNTIPTINVADAFTGGGAQIGTRNPGQITGNCRIIRQHHSVKVRSMLLNLVCVSAARVFLTDQKMVLGELSLLIILPSMEIQYWYVVPDTI